MLIWRLHIKWKEVKFILWSILCKTKDTKFMVKGGKIWLCCLVMGVNWKYLWLVRLQDLKGVEDEQTVLHRRQSHWWGHAGPQSKHPQPNNEKTRGWTRFVTHLMHLHDFYTFIVVNLSVDLFKQDDIRLVNYETFSGFSHNRILIHDSWMLKLRQNVDTLNSRRWLFYPRSCDAHFANAINF